LLCVALLPLSSAPHIIAVPTTAAIIGSIVIVVTHIVAIITIIKKQHILAYSSSPSFELEIPSSLLAALSRWFSIRLSVCLWLWHSCVYLTLGVLVGVALLCVLNVDAELGQVTIVVVVVIVVDNGVAIVIVVVFAAAACCCCSYCPRKIMTTRQAVAAVTVAQRGGLWWDGGNSSGNGGCTTCLHTPMF
jgi:hypothetical protein